MSNLNFNATKFNATQKTNITLDQLLDTVGKTVTSDQNTVRLHTKTPKKGETTYRVNIHTKKSILSNANKNKKLAHNTKKQGGVDLVKDAIVNQFGCTMNEATTILGKTGSHGIQLTLGQLKDIKVQARLPMTETLLKEAAKDSSQARSLQIAKAMTAFPDNIPTRNEARRLVNDLQLADNPVLKTLVDQTKNGSPSESQAALAELRKMKAGLARGDLQVLFKDNESARQVLAVLGEVLDSALSEALKNITANDLIKNGSSRSQHWEGLSKVKDQGQPMDINKFKQEGLNEMLQVPSTDWEPTTSGTSGAIIVKGGEGGGSVLKIDSDSGVTAGESISNYISNVVSGLSKKGVEPRFDGMVVTRLDVQSKQKELDNRLQEMLKNDSSRRTQDVVDQAGSMLSQNLPAMKCGFVSNATSLDKLATTDKVVLCKGNLLPQQLGQAMILGRMFGLSDHVNIKYDGNPNQAFLGGYSNMPNLMIKNDTGKLVFIDYNATLGGRANNKPGFSADQMKNAFSCLSDFATTNLTTGTIDKTLANIIKNPGPLRDLLQSIFSVDDSAGLFKSFEESAIDLISDQDKSRFAANVMLGAIQALQLVAKNQDVFNGNDAMFDDPKDVTKHIETLADKLDGIAKNLEEYLKKHPSSL